jgi:hypothetical protein
MDDYVDILMRIKVLASVPNSGRLAVRRGSRLTRVSTVSVYYGSGTAIRGNRPSIIKKNTVAGVIRTSDDIMHIAGLPKWKDLWNLSRIAKVKSRIRSTLRRLISMQERLHRYKSHPNASKLGEVILRFIAVRSGNKRYD